MCVGVLGRIQGEIVLNWVCFLKGNMRFNNQDISFNLWKFETELKLLNIRFFDKIQLGIFQREIQLTKLTSMTRKTNIIQYTIQLKAKTLLADSLLLLEVVKHKLNNQNTWSSQQQNRNRVKTFKETKGSTVSIYFIFPYFSDKWACTNR